MAYRFFVWNINQLHRAYSHNDQINVRWPAHSFNIWWHSMQGKKCTKQVKQSNHCSTIMTTVMTMFKYWARPSFMCELVTLWCSLVIYWSCLYVYSYQILMNWNKIRRSINPASICWNCHPKQQQQWLFWLVNIASSGEQHVFQYL